MDRTQDRGRDAANPGDEFGGIAETLYQLAAATKKIDGPSRVTVPEEKLFNRWPRIAMSLRGLHANTHIPQAIAAARRYEIQAICAS